MFCEKFNILFIHIPKTGGTSIENYFGEFDAVNDWGKNKCLKSDKHLTLQEYYDYKILPYDVLDNAKKFTVVRNPLDKLWSNYLYEWRNFIDWNFYLQKVRVRDFSDNNYCYRYIQGHTLTMHTDGYRHIIPQHMFVDDSVEILHTETLDTDFNNFLLNNNLPIKELTRENVTIPLKDFEMERWSHNTDLKLINDIVEIYKDDFIKFGYKIPGVLSLPRA